MAVVTVRVSGRFSRAYDVVDGASIRGSGISDWVWRLCLSIPGGGKFCFASMVAG